MIPRNKLPYILITAFAFIVFLWLTVAGMANQFGPDYFVGLAWGHMAVQVIIGIVMNLHFK